MSRKFSAPICEHIPPTIKKSHHLRNNIGAENILPVVCDGLGAENILPVVCDGLGAENILPVVCDCLGAENILPLQIPYRSNYFSIIKFLISDVVRTFPKITITLSSFTLSTLPTTAPFLNFT